MTGARGRPPTPFYKASLTFLGGFQLSGGLLIGGIDAKRKALAVAGNSIFNFVQITTFLDGIVGRVRRIYNEQKLGDFEDVNVEVLGAESIYGPHGRADNAREVFLRITVSHPNKQALAIMSKEMAPSALSMAPGITGSVRAKKQTNKFLRIYHSTIAVLNQLGRWKASIYTVSLIPLVSHQQISSGTICLRW